MCPRKVCTSLYFTILHLYSYVVSSVNLIVRMIHLLFLCYFFFFFSDRSTRELWHERVGVNKGGYPKHALKGAFPNMQENTAATSVANELGAQNVKTKSEHEPLREGCGREKEAFCELVQGERSLNLDKRTC